ncbi:unnamed protein product [Caenorhabditis angaria]|uniref:Glucuronosyltransferase n=1 Tax=Caenorhabditis angaria TaxID=860376 RepID=A0A9P1IH80_9PELO|nr:unnamed protein product [Caenorhabditis angaria]
MKLEFYILIILALNVLSILGDHQRPKCPEPTKNTKLSTSEKPIIVFVVGFGNIGNDKENIAYLLNQLACWIPNNENVRSGAFHTFNKDMNTYDHTQVKKTWNFIKDFFEEPNSIASCANFTTGLQFLKTYNWGQVDKIKLIVHDDLMTGTTNCDHKKLFDDAQMGAKFELYQVKFTNGNDPNTMYYPNVATIKTGKLDAPADLKTATKNFMQRILGADTNSKAKSSKQSDDDYTLLIVIVVIVVIVGLMIGVLLIIFRKKICKKLAKKNDKKEEKSENTDEKTDPLASKQPSSVPKKEDYPSELLI